MEEVGKKARAEGGAVTYWGIDRRSNLGTVREAFDSVGLLDRAPEERAAHSILRDALVDVLGGPTVLVRPLQEAKRFGVVRELRGRTQSGNLYDTALTAWCDDMGTPRFETTSGPWDALAASLQVSPYDLIGTLEGKFEWLKGVASQGQVSAALVSAASAMHGTTLRPSGAVYWVPERSVEKWSRLAGQVEGAALDRKSVVYLLRMFMDMDSARAILDAITHEVESQLGTIEREVEAGDLQRRGLENRVEASTELREKVALYAEFLQQPLETLTAQCDRVKTLSATAIMDLSASLAAPSAGNGSGYRCDRTDDLFAGRS
jgi:hypothetical protein